MSKCILFIISVVLGFYILEGAFRLLFLKDKVPNTEQEFVTLIASSWPRFVSVERKSDTYRILGLADSFGQAGKESNYHYLLESFLRDKGIKIEVVNISVSEYELLEELTLLKRFGTRYRPDLVLHSVYVGNDLSVPEGRLMNYRGISVRVKNSLWPHPHNFSLLQWLKRYMSYIHEHRRWYKERKKNKTVGIFSEEGFLKIEQGDMQVCSIEHTVDSRWQEVIKLFDEIRNETLRMGASYIMVIHPDRFQIEEELRSQIMEKYRLKSESYDFELPQKFLKNYCSSRGILYIDLLPVFASQKVPQDSFYLKQDSHYNINGNKLVAQVICDFLENQNLFVNSQKKKYNYE